MKIHRLAIVLLTISGQIIVNGLLSKAQELEQYAEQNFVDENGVVYACLNERTNKPWTASDLTPEDDFLRVPGFEAWEVLNYENSGMTTGAYLAAQSYRYLVTKDAAALQRAQRSFRGLQWIYEVGREREEGFYPKTYGARISHEISSDQYLYAIKGMMAYLPIAPPEDAAEIRTMIVKMVDFWVKRDYRFDYFGIKDMQWPLGRFPSLLYAAHAVSGDEKYLQEARRLNNQYQVYQSPIESQLLMRVANQVPFSEVEQKLGNRYLGVWISECTAMDVMELDECLLHSSDHREEWLQSMLLSWEEGKLGLDENGQARAWTLYDPETKTATTPPPQFTSEPDALNWNFGRWISGSLSGRSPMLARVGVHVAKWLPESGAQREVAHILESIGLEEMRHCIDPDGEQIHPEHKFMTRWIDGDALTNWLWAYWQGRCEEVLERPSE